jgi:exonuclease III
MSNNIINFCTLNVNGLQKKDKQRRLLQWIKNQNCSIVFLQETHRKYRRQKNRQKPISVASQERKSQIATLATDSAIPGT